MARKDRFNADATIQKYSLDVSTFDAVDVDSFNNHKFSTLFWYLYMWVLALLSIILLATDIYTCLNILVFKKWGTEDGYKPYAYSIAKWLFTGCIIFQFCLLVYHWIWAIHIYNTKNIALVYLNMIAKRIYSIRSYNYFCLFNAIDEGSFFDWSCFLVYNELDNALQILVADTPRQVINIMTLRFYATGGESNNNILENIRWIAQTNFRLSIILGFMCLSVFIYALFMLKFLFAMVMYVPIRCSLSGKEQHTIKSYCCSIVNKSVAIAVRQHHKSKQQLLDKVSESRIGDLPLFPKPSDKKDQFVVRTESVDSFIPLNNLKLSKRPPPTYNRYSSSNSSHTMSKSTSSHSIPSTTGTDSTILPFPLKKELAFVKEDNESIQEGEPQRMFSPIQQQGSRLELLRSREQLYEQNNFSQSFRNANERVNHQSNEHLMYSRTNSQPELHNQSRSHERLMNANASQEFDLIPHGSSQHELYQPNKHMMHINRSQEFNQPHTQEFNQPDTQEYQSNDQQIYEFQDQYDQIYPHEQSLSPHNISNTTSPVYEYSNNQEQDEFAVHNFERQESQSPPYPVRGLSLFDRDRNHR